MRIALSTILGENLEIGIQSLASLDTAADPTSLPHFAAPGPSPARQFHSLASCLSFLLPSSHSFIRSTDQAEQSASSAALAPPNNELAGLCRGPLDLTNCPDPRHLSFRAAPIFTGASEHHRAAATQATTR